MCYAIVKGGRVGENCPVLHVAKRLGIGKMYLPQSSVWGKEKLCLAQLCTWNREKCHVTRGRGWDGEHVIVKGGGTGKIALCKGWVRKIIIALWALQCS